MNIDKIAWNYDSAPQCVSSDIVVLIQDGEVEIAIYICPKPKGMPECGGNFIFEVCNNEDDLE